ncbi:hypothetical protein ACGFIK_20730 [Micromonospora sp. NPDC048871]|uniref:hypothetical protein n=1 Tax=unclassified Micromonospora TaxID=2617518 RepID=UPI002E0DF58D|nr:hypothetical protein OIE53_18720 [Micromonospora sp. NBC_01739]
MSHPQPSDGPQDPQERPPSDPWAPLHPPGEPQDGTWAGYSPDHSDYLWATPEPPGDTLSPAHPPAPVYGTPQPTSGTPYPQPYPPDRPTSPPGPSHGPYPPGFGSPAGPTPLGGAYPPGGSGHPTAPVRPGGRKSLAAVSTLVVIAVLGCIGGITAVLLAWWQLIDETNEVLQDPPSASAPQQPGTPATEGPTFNMRPGDTLVLTDDQGTVEITVTKFHLVSNCHPSAPAPEKGKLLIAEVTARVTKGTGAIDSADFHWTAADGNTTDNGLIGSIYGCSGHFKDDGNDLPAGSTRKGQVVFDVADTNGVLEYRDPAKALGSWKPE